MGNTLAADLSLKDITSGDVFSFIVYQAGTTTAQPLSGWSFTAKVRSARGSASVIVTLTNPTDITVSSDASGLVSVFFTPATKATILAALGSGVEGVWGVQGVDGSGNVYVFVEGQIEVQQSVPR